MSIAVCGKKYTSCEQGTAGILSVLTMALLLVIGSGMLAVSSTEIRTATAYRDGIAAQYAAEAGARRGLVELNANNSWSGITNATAIGNGSYIVAVSGTGSSRTITSTGTVNKSTRRVIVKVLLSSVGGSLGDYAAYSGGTLNLYSGSSITGNVGSGNSITLYKDSLVTGDAYVPSNADFTQYNATLTGNIRSPVPSVSLPPMPSNIFANSGPQVTTPTLPTAIYGGSSQLLDKPYYYVNGSFETGNVTLTIPSGSSATIYAAGSVTFNSGTSISGNITIISASGGVQFNSAIAASGNFNIYAYGSSGTVFLNSSSSIAAANIQIVSASPNTPATELNNCSSITVPANGVVKIYSNGSVQLNQGTSISGNGLIMANGGAQFNGTTAPNTVVVSETNTTVALNSGSVLGPVYAAGTLNLNNSSSITYNNTLLQNLGFSLSSASLQVQSWNNH